MTEDEKKLMELVEEYASADCLMSEYAGSKEEEDEYRADRDAAGEAILAMYRLTRGRMGGLRGQTQQGQPLRGQPPAPVFEGTRFYLDEEGGKWVEDPQGAHGWWSEVPGTEDCQGNEFNPWDEDYDEKRPHGERSYNGEVLRYYRRIS